MVSLLKRVFWKGQDLYQYAIADTYRALAQSSQSPEVINQVELKIIGLRRTGNHAVAEWIKAQIPGPIEHLNNLAVGCNPYRYKHQKLIRFHREHKDWAIQHYLPRSQGNFKPLDYLICGYEEHSLDTIAGPVFERRHDLYLGASGMRIDVLILRDPFNLFASRLKSRMIEVQTPGSTMVSLWLQYAKEFLGETQYLSNQKVCINYNRWFLDSSYRQKIAQELGLVFTDAGLDRVVSLGGGSSFDGQSMDGSARKMAVLDRWRHFAEDDRYRALFQDSRLFEYSRQIFGEIPDTEHLLMTDQG
jgi:hypothetical protein